MDEIKAVITQGQGLVGATLTGATAAVANNEKGPSKVLKEIRDINEETRDNTQSFLDTMNKIFNFDKEKFRREQDQMRELAKEATKRGAAAAQSVKTTIDEYDGYYDNDYLYDAKKRWWAKIGFDVQKKT